MTVRKLLSITVSAVYFLITGFLSLAACYCVYEYVAYIIDKSVWTPYGLALFSFFIFIAQMTVSALISFFNKKYSKISFIMGLVALFLVVLWYNHIFIFEPSLYPVLQ